jgi:hypothetical protein
MICMKISASGQEAGMMDFDVGAMTFGPYVSVAPAMAMDSPLASNLTYTSAGLLFSYLTGGATSGSRKVFHIDPTSYAVSPGVMVAGMSNNLDEQDAVGTTVWMTQLPSNQVVPFDVATMTAGNAVSVSHPRHLRTGGGQVFVGMRGMPTEPTGDGAVAKIDPATGTVAFRTFPKPGSEVESLAFTGP